MEDLDAEIEAEMAKPEETPETPEVDASSDSPEESAPPAKDSGEGKPQSSGVQKRINELTAKRYEEEGLKRKAEEKVRELEVRLSEAQQKIPAKTLEDFDFDESAFSDHQINLKVSEQVNAAVADRIASEEKKVEALKRQQSAIAIEQAHVGREVKFIEATPDYVEALNSLPKMAQEIVDTIMQTDNSPQVAYYLAKNPDVAMSIANADPITAAMKIGSISSSLANNTKTVQISKAPNPVEPVTSGGGISKPVDEMSMEEIMNTA